MKLASKIAFAAMLGLGALTAGASTASAYVICNGAGECWHTRYRYAYHPEWGIVVHPNGWRWGAGERFVWREHVGRGYWRNGVWITF